MSHWFRFYDDVPDDPKLARLNDSQYRMWTHLLCIASRHPEGEITPSISDLAHTLRKPHAKICDTLQVLLSGELLDRLENGSYRPHNWHGRQYKSDRYDPTNSERQKRYRNAHSNVTPTVTDTVTAKRPDTEQIQSRTDTEKKTSLRSVQKTTMPDGCPSDGDRRKALEYWASKQRPDLDVAEQASAFRVHCQANGKKYVDWSSAWQTWYVRAIEFNRPKPPTQSMGSKVISILDVEAKRGAG